MITTESHENFTDSGLHINPKWPFMDAMDLWIAIIVVREYAKLNVLTVSDMLQ